MSRTTSPPPAAAIRAAPAIVPITCDRGLAGAFNAQVLRRSFALMREIQQNGQEAVFYSSGKKAASTLRFRRLDVGHSWTGFSDRPSYADAQTIAHSLAEAYVNGEVDRVVIVYNAFVSALVQKVTVRDVLPIPQDLLEQAEEAELDAMGHTPDFIYEPEPEEILEPELQSVAGGAACNNNSAAPHLLPSV